MGEEVPNKYKSELTLLNRYKITVSTTEKYYPGDSKGMEGIPGTFLESTIRLEGITEPCSPIEKLASQYKVVLTKRNKEITNEPEGYADLFHRDFIKKIQENPEIYLSEDILQKKVKERL